MLAGRCSSTASIRRSAGTPGPRRTDRDHGLLAGAHPSVEFERRSRTEEGRLRPVLAGDRARTSMRTALPPTSPVSFSAWRSSKRGKSSSRRRHRSRRRKPGIATWRNGLAATNRCAGASVSSRVSDERQDMEKLGMALAAQIWRGLQTASRIDHSLLAVVIVEPLGCVAAGARTARRRCTRARERLALCGRLPIAPLRKPTMDQAAIPTMKTTQSCHDARMRRARPATGRDASR